MKKIELNTIKKHVNEKHNAPFSPWIKIEIYIYLDQKSRTTTLFLDIVSILVEHINGWFQKYHHYHFQTYLFNINFILIFDKDDSDFENPIANNTHRKKVNNKVYSDLSEFGAKIENINIPLEYKKELNLLHEYYNKKIKPHIIGHEQGRISISESDKFPFPSERSLPYYRDFFARICENVTERLRKPSEIDYEPFTINSILKLDYKEDNKHYEQWFKLHPKRNRFKRHMIIYCNITKEVLMQKMDQRLEEGLKKWREKEMAKRNIENKLNDKK